MTKKKFTVILLSVWLLCAFAIPVFAEEEAAADETLHHVMDEAELFQDNQCAALEERAETIYVNYGADMLLYTTNDSLGDGIASKSEDIYEQYARTDSSVVILVDADRLYIQAFGRADYFLTDEDIDDISNATAGQDSFYSDMMAYIKRTGELLGERGAMPLPEERLQPRVVDEANLLSESKEAALLEKLDEISERQQFDVVVVTVSSTDAQTAEQYADDYYDYNGYGYGKNRDGVLLLIAMEHRDWHITTTGYGLTAITDEGVDYISDAFLSDLSDGNYYDSFCTYADLCDKFVTQAKTGKPYDVGHMPKDPFGVFGGLVTGLAVGGVSALIVVSSMKSGLKSVAPQGNASQYTKQGSFKLTEKKDIFLYHVVTRTERPKDTNSGSSGGGGSHSHSSSSGSGHGGGGGHF